MSHVGEKSFEQGSTFQSIWTKMSVPRSMWATELMRFHASTHNALSLFCNWISLVCSWASWSISAKRLLSPLKDVPWTMTSNQSSFQSLSKQYPLRHPVTTQPLLTFSQIFRVSALFDTFCWPNSHSSVPIKSGEPELSGILLFILLALHSV